MLSELLFTRGRLREAQQRYEQARCWTGDPAAAARRWNARPRPPIGPRATGTAAGPGGRRRVPASR